MAQRFTFIRHGQAEHNVLLDTGDPDDREKGKAIRDPALTLLGREQAQKLQDLLRNARFDLVITSPFLRALQTTAMAFEAPTSAARILAQPACGEHFGLPCDQGRPLTTLTDDARLPRAFRRRDGGRVDWSAVAQAEEDTAQGREGEAWWTQGCASSGNEASERVALRALVFKRHLLSRHRPEPRIAVVAHGGFFRRLLGVSFENGEFRTYTRAELAAAGVPACIISDPKLIRGSQPRRQGSGGGAGGASGGGGVPRALVWLATFVLVAVVFFSLPQLVVVAGARVPVPVPAANTPPAPGKIFDITAFGAVGDGVTKNTGAFERAIEACADAVINGAGCEVVVPAGGVFLTGSFNLTSGMTFTVDGTILGSPDPSDYPLLPPLPSWGGSYYCEKGHYGGNFFHAANDTATHGYRHAALVHAVGVRGVLVRGRGEVNGNGLPWLERCHDDGIPYDRPHMVQFEYSSDLQFLGPLVFNNSANWNFHLYDCERVEVGGGLRLNNPRWPALGGGTGNTDGLDIDSCRDVHVHDITVAVNDNTLCIKSGLDGAGVAYGHPTENVLLEDITLLRGGSMAIGSDSSGGARNITFRRIRARGMATVIDLKTRRGRGGLVEDVVFDEIEATGTHRLYQINMWYFCNVPGRPPIPAGANCSAVAPPSLTPSYRNITFSNIRAALVQTGPDEPHAVGVFNGLPESIITGIVMDNVTVTYADGVTPASWGSGACNNTQGTVTKTVPAPPCLT